jgi:Domain of unknown function (DUF4157)
VFTYDRRVPPPTATSAPAPSRAPRAPARTPASNPLVSAAAPHLVNEVVRGGGGRPLDPGTRAYFEHRMGRNLGGVRIHDDPRAHASAGALRASAYTAGRDIAFARGAYAPGTPAGQRLLAHELTHVAQQGGRAATGALDVAPSGSAAEHEAARAADHDGPGAAISPHAPAVQCEQPHHDEDPWWIPPGHHARWSVTWLKENYGVPHWLAWDWIHSTAVQVGDEPAQYDSTTGEMVLPEAKRDFFRYGRGYSIGSSFGDQTEAFRPFVYGPDAERPAQPQPQPQIDPWSAIGPMRMQVGFTFLQIALGRLSYFLDIKQIPRRMTAAIESGALTETQAAEAAVQSRRAVEAAARLNQPEWVAEGNAARNRGLYGDPLGPSSFEQARIRSGGREPKTEAEVIEGSGRSSSFHNRVAGALGVLGFLNDLSQAMVWSKTSNEYGYVDVWPFRIITDESKIPSGTPAVDFFTGERGTIESGHFVSDSDKYGI